MRFECKRLYQVHYLSCRLLGCHAAWKTCDAALLGRLLGYTKVGQPKISERTTLNLLIDPQKGLISKLQRLVKYESGSEPSDFRLALFTGPDGASAPMGDFERVLMVASGIGIVAQLPWSDFRGGYSSIYKTQGSHVGS